MANACAGKCTNRQIFARTCRNPTCYAPICRYFYQFALEKSGALPSQTLLQLHTDKQIQKCLPFSAMANNTSDRQFSPNAKAVVDLADHLALTSNSLFTGTEHLLQALLDSPCRYRRMFCCEIQYRSSIGGLPHPSPMMMTQLMLTFPQLSE